MKPPPLPHATHEELVENILTLLAGYGIPASETDASRAFGRDGKPRKSKVKPGWPDISGTLPGGRSLYVEAKVGRDKLRPEQVRMLMKLHCAGALVIVARSVDDVQRRIAVPVATAVALGKSHR